MIPLNLDIPRLDRPAAAATPLELAGQGHQQRTRTLPSPIGAEDFWHWQLASGWPQPGQRRPCSEEKTGREFEFDIRGPLRGEVSLRRTLSRTLKAGLSDSPLPYMDEKMGK